MPRSESRLWWLERVERYRRRWPGPPRKIRLWLRDGTCRDGEDLRGASYVEECLWRLVQWQRIRLERINRAMCEGVIEHLEIGPSGADITIRNKLATQVIARALVGMLRDAGGGAMPDNFAVSTITVPDPDLSSFERFAMTVQRVAKGKLSPQEKLAMQDAALLDADAAVQEARCREEKMRARCAAEPSAEPIECYVNERCSAGQRLLDADAAVREARCREEEMRVREEHAWALYASEVEDNDDQWGLGDPGCDYPNRGSGPGCVDCEHAPMGEDPAGPTAETAETGPGPRPPFRDDTDIPF